MALLIAVRDVFKNNEAIPGKERITMQHADESASLRQRWLPQTSIRFLFFLSALCAVAMYTFRIAFLGDQLWAKIAALLMATALGCFLVYSGLFVVAYCFSTATGLVWNAASGWSRSAGDESSRQVSGDR